MTGTFELPAPRRTTWLERLFVLGGPALAALYTAASLALGGATEHIGLAWMAAIAWTVIASLAGALRRGFRYGDWSPFRRARLPERRDDLIDMDGQTGMYLWMQDWEDRLLHDDEHLRNHDHG